MIGRKLRLWGAGSALAATLLLSGCYVEPYGPYYNGYGYHSYYSYYPYYSYGSPYYSSYPYPASGGTSPFIGGDHGQDDGGWHGGGWRPGD
jgi:hypothetical protein